RSASSLTAATPPELYTLSLHDALPIFRAARRGRVTGGGGTARRSAVCVVLSELHVLGARDSGAHRLAHPQHAAPALDAGGGAAGGRGRRAPHRHACLDRPRPPGRAQPGT